MRVLGLRGVSVSDLGCQACVFHAEDGELADCNPSRTHSIVKSSAPCRLCAARPVSFAPKSTTSARKSRSTPADGTVRFKKPTFNVLYGVP